MPTKPWKVGWTESSHKFGRETVRKHQLRLSEATMLKDLAEEYVFYTPALLHIVVPLQGCDPFTVFLQEYNKEVLPLSVRLNRPIFKGLDLGPIKDWNYLLFAMERKHFKHYLPWMQSLTFADRPRNRIYRLGEKQIRIADPIFFERAVILPQNILGLSLIRDQQQVPRRDLDLSWAYRRPQNRLRPRAEKIQPLIPLI